MVKTSQFCWTLAAIIACSLMTSCGGKNGGDQKADASPDAPKPPVSGKDDKPPSPPPAKTVPDVTLTAKELAEEINKGNPFPGKYGGKIIQLTGTVKRQGPLFNGLGQLFLEGASKPNDEVNCLMKSLDDWKKAFPGHIVTLRGEASSTGTSPIEWEIVKVKGPQPPVLTAAELAKEYAADLKAAMQKYGKKTLILTGEIATAEPRGVDMTLTLKTGVDQPVVKCEFRSGEKGIRSLKVGDKLKVAGGYDKLNNSPDVVRLDDCIILEIVR